MKRKKSLSTNILIKFSISILLFHTMWGTILGYTNASFSDKETLHTLIGAGTWELKWDKSSLSFPNGENDLEINCSETQITVTLSNVSENPLINTVNYFVHYSPTNAISKNNPGTEIKQDSIQSIPAHSSIPLTFTNSDGLLTGHYKFSVENHKYKEGGMNFPKSESILVTCIETQQSDSNDSQNTEIPPEQPPENNDEENATPPSEEEKSENEQSNETGGDSNQDDEGNEEDPPNPNEETDEHNPNQKDESPPKDKEENE